jgi:hypothetical protein
MTLRRRMISTAPRSAAVLPPGFEIPANCGDAQHHPNWGHGPPLRRCPTRLIEVTLPKEMSYLVGGMCRHENLRSLATVTGRGGRGSPLLHRGFVS